MIVSIQKKEMEENRTRLLHNYTRTRESTNRISLKTITKNKYLFYSCFVSINSELIILFNCLFEFSCIIQMSSFQKLLFCHSFYLNSGCATQTHTHDLLWSSIFKQEKKFTERTLNQQNK